VSLALGALTLNGGGPVSPAIPLRFNRLLPLATPEWRAPGGSVGVACYTLDRLGSGPPSVRAHLAASGAEAGRPLEIRAIPQPLAPFAWWPSSIAPALTWPSVTSAGYWLWLYGLLANGREAEGSAFGQIAPQSVTIPASGALDHDFAVSGDQLARHGVNTHAVRWRWQYRHDASDGWTDFAFTPFTVYVVLTAPTPPWVLSPVTPLNTQLPWIEVLSLACAWAAGSTTATTAAARVTEAINGLGRAGILAYDCDGSSVFHVGTPHYTLVPGVFECSEFLERVRGGLGNGRFVNCSDCASAVSTFANVLGCNLSQSRMFGLVPFPLNPTRSIGSPSWRSACGTGVYSMHEVAWTGNCGEDDTVFDACLELDGDADPTRPPHRPQLPVGMRFGAAGEGQYRDRLAAPAGRAVCEPQPSFRQRRFLV
jgi:hypothetical protein